jgi:hypothetical protein
MTSRAAVIRFFPGFLLDSESSAFSTDVGIELALSIGQWQRTPDNWEKTS